MIYTVEITARKEVWKNQQGQFHREDGPAFIYADGTQYWYRNGQLHREDGPAIIHADGAQKWCRNGLLHREDGPAVIYADGVKEWYRDGQYHREDGPAIIHVDGTKRWYLHGEKLSEEEFNQRTTVTADCSGRVVEIDGVQYELKKLEETS